MLNVKTHNVVAAFQKFAGPYSVTNSHSMPSRQGIAFSCDLWLGPRKLGQVSCQGCGDMVFFRVSADDLAAIKAHAISVLAEDDQYSEPEGTWISYLLDYMDSLRRLRRLVQKKPETLFYVKPQDIDKYGLPSEVRGLPGMRGRPVDGVVLNAQLI